MSVQFTPSQLSPPCAPIQHSTEFDPCFTLAKRPLTIPTDPSQFMSKDLWAIHYDDQGPRMVFEDAESDDFVGVALYETEPLLIAEKHDKRGQEFERTQELLKALGKNPNSAVIGAPESLPRLIEVLQKLPDHSLRITLTAPSPTFQALIKAAPDLLAQKTKRIVALGGFTHRPCEYGKKAGEECYYTSHNLSANLDAAQGLFSFAEAKKIPCFVLSTDNLRLGRHLNFDIPHKIRSMDTPGAEYLLKDMFDWNQCSVKGKLKEKLEKLAHENDYEDLDVMKYSMTPADPIAVVFDLAFDSLDITTTGVSNIEITDEPRYEKNRDGEWEPTKHRVTSFGFSDESSVRFVDKFRLKGTDLDSTRTFEVLINHLLNRFSYNQINQPKGVLMTTQIKSVSSGAIVFPAPQDTQQAPPATVGVIESTSSIAIISPPQMLPKTISIETLAKENPEMDIPNAKRATFEQIQMAVKMGDYFGLQSLFKSTVVAEAQSNNFNYELRLNFMEAFTALRKQFIQEGIPEEVAPEQLNELNIFIKEGRGAESVRIFAKILIAIDLNDPDYPAKMMQIAKNKWHMRAHDRIPGDGEFLSVRCPEMKKTEVALAEPLLLDERRALQAERKKEALERLAKISSSLNAHQIYRGMIGSGKSTLGREHQFDESLLVSGDSLKSNFGGQLSHHECCALMDAIVDQSKKIPYKVDMRTNVYQRNTEDFCKLQGVPKVMYDIHVTAATAKKRIDFRVENEAGRPASDTEIAETYDNSLKNRPGIIEEARTNPLAEWHLFDNNDLETPLIEVARIVNCKLTVVDAGRFIAMLNDPHFFNAMQAFKPAPTV